VAQIGLAIATGGLSITEQIAANMAVQVLSGKDIGDAIKNAAVSLAVAQIPGTDFMKSSSSFIKDLNLPTEVTNTLNNSFQNAAISGTKALLTGQDIGQAVINGATTGGINGALTEITNSIDGFKDLSKPQQRMVVNAVTGIISGKPMDQILVNTAIAAANAEMAEQKKYAPLDDKALSELSDEERKVYDESGTKGLMAYNKAAKDNAVTNATDQTVDNLKKAGLTEDNTVDVKSDITKTDVTSLPVDIIDKTKNVNVLPTTPADNKTVEITGKQETKTNKADTCPIGTFYNPDTDSCDPISSSVTTPVEPTITPPVTQPVTPPVITPAPIDAGTVNVSNKSDTCPVGTFYNPDTDSCDPISSQVSTPIVTPVVTPVVTPTVTPIEPVTSTVPNAGTVNVTSKSDTCPIGTVYNPDTDSCDPVIEYPVTKSNPPVVTPTVVPSPILPSAGTVTVTGKSDTCPIGTVYNPVTDTCDPYWDETGTKEKEINTTPTSTVNIGEQPKIIVTGKRDTCPIGTVYNPVTDTCDPSWDETGTPTTSGPNIGEQPTMVVTGKKDTCPIGTFYNEATDSCDPVTTQPAPQIPIEPVTTQPVTSATPVKVSPVKPTVTKPVVTSTASAPYQEQAQPAPRWVTPDLANVYYYGKDFSSKRQKINKEGELEQEPYTELGEPVYAALGGLVDEQKNRENNANDALDLILGQSSNSLSLDDLLNIVKGS
jgi:ribosomal protein L12E/L44/L45/RPP1/RPP2